MTLARACRRTVEFAARYGARRTRLDRAMAAIAIRAVRLYQRILSRHTGRVCLFAPSCSHRAIALFDAHGWATGIAAVEAQLKRCGGDYTLCVTCAGETILTTSDGQRFTTEEISPLIRSSARRPVEA